MTFDVGLTCTQCGGLTSPHDTLCLQCYKIKQQAIVSKAKAMGISPVPAMKNGEIKKLPKGNSPMWTEQWVYQGSAKAPYIISSKKKPGNGSTTGWDLQWACSCPDWTKHSPRADCKHIIAVKLKEKMIVEVSVPSSMDPAMKKDFEKFLAQKQADGVQSSKIKHGALEEKGRRFRV